MLLGSLIVVGLCEFRRSRRQLEFPAMRRRVGNIGFWLANLVIVGFFLGSPHETRAGIEAISGVVLPAWPIADAGLSLAVGILLLDFLRYAVHRCEHAVPLLWRFHALHHSDPDVDVTTAVRHHPLEYLLASTVYWIALIVLDVPAGVVLVDGAAVFVIAAVQHGNIRLPERLERWLRPVLVTIDLHRVHHSISADEANSNYGAVLSLWDRLFGTLTQITPAQHQAMVFGVAELPRRDCLKPSAMLMTPWRLGRAEPRRVASGGSPSGG